MHLESDCRFKFYDNNRNSNLSNNNTNANSSGFKNTDSTRSLVDRNTKLVNTAELEELISNEANQKN